jgi:hypothetical protein
MKKTRKTGIVSPLNRLTSDQRSALIGWLTTGGQDGVGLAYADVQAKLDADFGIKTNISSLCNWWRQECQAMGRSDVKPVVRSPLERLPLHQKQALQGWLTTGGRYGRGMTYEQARVHLQAEFGVKVGCSAIHNFYRRRPPVDAAPGVSAHASSDGRTVTVTIQLNHK